MIKNFCALAFCFCFVFSLRGADTSDLDKIQGKWESKKITAEGDKITQRLEINKDKLIFKILGAGGNLRLYAVAKLKAEKVGPFSVLKVSDIKAGDSESDISPVDDDRTTIYQLRDGKLFLASNFEKERDEDPEFEIYEKTSK